MAAWDEKRKKNGKSKGFGIISLKELRWLRQVTEQKGFKAFSPETNATKNRVYLTFCLSVYSVKVIY